MFEKTADILPNACWKHIFVTEQIHAGNTSHKYLRNDKYCWKYNKCIFEK